MFDNSNYFNPWLVGLTDGDGSFVIVFSENKNKMYFCFKICLYQPNKKLLYFIKQKLGVGRIGRYDNMVCFRVQSISELKNVILPIFNKYPLLTRKQYRYEQFKQCLELYIDSSISRETKVELITKIWQTPIPVDYCSPVITNYLINKKNLNNFPITRPWLAGFIEAEGSFIYIIKDKKTGRICHEFSITQKNDLVLLELIAKVFSISSKIFFNKTKEYYQLRSSNSKSIALIIDYFSYSNKSKKYLRGFKGLEFRYWAHSFINYKKDYDELYRLREKIRRWRSKIYIFKA